MTEGLLLFRVLDRHTVKQYDADIERPRGERWEIRCRCGYICVGPDADTVEAGFGRHVARDADFVVASRPSERAPQ